MHCLQLGALFGTVVLLKSAARWLRQHRKALLAENVGSYELFLLCYGATAADSSNLSSRMKLCLESACACACTEGSASHQCLSPPLSASSPRPVHQKDIKCSVLQDSHFFTFLTSAWAHSFADNAQLPLRYRQTATCSASTSSMICCDCCVFA